MNFRKKNTFGSLSAMEIFPCYNFCEMWSIKVIEWYISHLSSPHTQTDEMYKFILEAVWVSLEWHVTPVEF